MFKEVDMVGSVQVVEEHRDHKYKQVWRQRASLADAHTYAEAVVDLAARCNPAAIAEVEVAHELPRAWLGRAAAKSKKTAYTCCFVSFA